MVNYVPIHEERGKTGRNFYTTHLKKSYDLAVMMSK